MTSSTPSAGFESRKRRITSARVAGATIGVLAAVALVSGAGRVGLFDGSFEPDDCGPVNELCPDVLAGQFESAEDCAELDDLSSRQLADNRYYFSDPYGREQTWQHILDRRWEELMCERDYQ